jgi:hypothetical protein
VIVALVWAGVVVFALVRTEALIRHWLTLVYPPALPTEQDVEVPQDIMALAMRESEEWAQEEVLKAAKERFLKVKDTTMPDAQRWNLVRRALGIGELA